MIDGISYKESQEDQPVSYRGHRGEVSRIFYSIQLLLSFKMANLIMTDVIIYSHFPNHETKKVIETISIRNLKILQASLISLK